MKARVRMYRQGLGDCFLLSFWKDDEDQVPTHVLIDCGVITGTPNAKQEVTKVVEHIRKELGDAEGLHAMVGTHEHWDHISGFNQARALFDAIKTREIWLGWTENVEDQQACELSADRSLRLNQLRTALHVGEGLFGARANEPSSPLGITRSALAFFDGGELGAVGASSTRDAIDYLRTRECQRRRYLEPGDTFAIRGVPGLRVFVLGPPRDETFLRKDRPSTSNPETYHLARKRLNTRESVLAAVERAASEGGSRAVDPGAPFDPFFHISVDQAQSHTTYQHRYFDAPGWRRIDCDWIDVVGDLALDLDSDTNNTSLVLAFELGDGGNVILMAADAQVGNWQSWAKVEFNYRVNNKARRVTAADLLARVVVYKVGHHASHNATLAEGGLEAMTHPDLVAMIPVKQDMAKAKGWNMPFAPLLAALQRKTRGRVLRLDEGAPDKSALRKLEHPEQESFLQSIVADDLYIDLLIESKPAS